MCDFKADLYAITEMFLRENNASVRQWSGKVTQAGKGNLITIERQQYLGENSAQLTKMQKFSPKNLSPVVHTTLAQNGL